VEFEERHRDDLEGVTALFELPSFLANDRILNEMREAGIPDKKEFHDRLFDVTEYQFLLTHYVIERSGNEAGASFLADFWNMCKRAAAALGASETFESMKIGILSQVAAYRLLETIGREPALSHPGSDATEAVDMVDRGDIFQVKTAANEFVIQEISKDGVITFPGIIERGPSNGRSYYIDTHGRELSAFRQSAERYRREHAVDENFKAIFMVIPAGMLDQTTGAILPKHEQAIKGALEAALGKG
jgi:hypothetical protein